MGEERLEPATEVLRSAGVSIAVPDVARRLVFVTVLVVVIAQASAVAGLGYFGDLADSIIRTIPAVCIGLAFLLAGIVAGRQAGRLVAAMALRGPVPAGFAGAATQAAIVAAAAVSAVDAMGISTTLPVALIALSVAALFGLAVAAGVLAARGCSRTSPRPATSKRRLSRANGSASAARRRRSRRSGCWPRSCALSRARGSPSPTRCCNEKQSEEPAGRRPGEREDTAEDVINGVQGYGWPVSAEGGGGTGDHHRRLAARARGVAPGAGGCGVRDSTARSPTCWAVAKGLQARSEQPAPSRSGSACCWWQWQRLKRWRWTR